MDNESERCIVQIYHSRNGWISYYERQIFLEYSHNHFKDDKTEYYSIPTRRPWNGWVLRYYPSIVHLNQEYCTQARFASIHRQVELPLSNNESRPQDIF